jgi:hypothetical protein
MRLGTNDRDYSIDYELIKAHPYFNGINFATLDRTSPPIPANKYQSYFEKVKGDSEGKDKKAKNMDKNNFVNTDFVSEGSDIVASSVVEQNKSN